MQRTTQRTTQRTHNLNKPWLLVSTNANGTTLTRAKFDDSNDAFHAYNLLQRATFPRSTAWTHIDAPGVHVARLGRGILGRGGVKTIAIQAIKDNRD